MTDTLTNPALRICAALAGLLLLAPAPALAGPRRADLRGAADVAKVDTAKPERTRVQVVQSLNPAGRDPSLSPALAAQALESVPLDAAKVKDPVAVFDIDDTTISTTTHLAAPGAVAYANQLIAAGVKVLFLTGRPERKRAFTIDQLQSLGFPVDAQHTLLVMNPKDGPPEPFKPAAKPTLEKAGTPIAFFDNEKNELQMFSQQYPSAQVFELNTVSASSYKGARPPSIQVINNFDE